MKEHVLLWKAVHALGIDLPIQSYEILGPQAIRLTLYGGRVVEYACPPLEPEVEKRRSAGRSGEGKGAARRGQR